MASELLKTFQKIEKGRLACIEKAHELGFTDVSENASFEDIRKCMDRAGFANEWELNFKSLMDTSLGGNITRWPENVTTLGSYALYKKENFDASILPDTVTSLGNYSLGYTNCTNLTKLPANLTYIGSNAFTNCDLSNLEELPNTLTKIGKNGFNGIVLPKLKNIPDNVELRIGSFSSSGLNSLEYFGNNINVTADKDESGTCIYNCTLTNIIELPETLSVDGNISVFNGCTFSNLTKMFKTINTKNKNNNSYGAFYNCTFDILEEFPEDNNFGTYSFTSCKFPSLTNFNKTTFNNYEFYSCTFDSIKDLTVDSSGTYSFYGAKFPNLESLVIKTPAACAFAGTSGESNMVGLPKLTTLKIGELPGVTYSAADVFRYKNCLGLTHLELNGKFAGNNLLAGSYFPLVEEIKGDFTLAGSNAFNYCQFPNLKKLPSVYLPYGAFQGATLTGLTDFSNLQNCGEYAFTSAKLSITELILPKTFTYMITRCFQYCSTIETIVFEAQEVEFHSYGLQNMTSLSKLVFVNIGTVPKLTSAISTLLSGSSKLSASAGYVYVPANLVAAMKAHSYWKTFGTRIKPLEDWSGYQNYLATHSTEE
jgi:hypothetical protein